MLTAISCTLPVALVSVGRAVTVLAGCCCLLSGGEVCLQAVLLACSHGRTGEPAVGGRQRKKPLTVLGCPWGGQKHRLCGRCLIRAQLAFPGRYVEQ